MTDDQIDELIRERLERRAESVDPRPRFERIRPKPVPVIETPRRRSIAWLALAASVIIGFGIAIQFRPTEIAAESIVRESQVAHRVPLDRCYLVEMKREPNAPFPARPDHSTVRLWTRGDRFWLESTTPLAKWSWGRDENGGVWLAAFNGRVGLRIEPDEVPPPLALQCDLNAMQPDNMLDEVLRNFELIRSTPGPEASATYVITAEPKTGMRPHPMLRRVVMEIDSETRVMRRVIITRGRPDQVFATTTYTLVDSAAQDDESYRLEGHLRPGTEILTRENQPIRRSEVFAKFFGPGLKPFIK